MAGIPAPRPAAATRDPAGKASEGGSQVSKLTSRLAGSFLAVVVAVGLFGPGTPARAADAIRVTVCITGSGGGHLTPGTTRYQVSGGGIAYFATTLDSNNCRYQDFPAGTGNVTISTTFNNTGASLTQNVSVDPSFDFNTHKLTLRLQTCAGDPLDGATTRYGPNATYGSWYFPGGATGTSASGEAVAEFFPGTYSFEMAFKGGTDRKLSVSVPNSDLTLVWTTTNVTIIYAGMVSYGGPLGDSTWFKQTNAPASMQMLPGTYKFHFRGGITTDLTFSGCSFTYGDNTPPMVGVSLSSPNGGTPDGTNGWFKTGPVTGTVSADDTNAGGSNIASISCTGGTLTDPQGIGTAVLASYSFTLTADGVHEISCTATDAAGNTSAAAILEVKIDTTAPTLSPTVDRNPVLLNGAAIATANAQDTGSGLADQGCDPIDTSVAGPGIVECSATDWAGNTATSSASYEVYEFGGFLAPVNDPPMVNLGKAGRTYPVKFRLMDGNGGFISALSAIQEVRQTTTACPGSSLTDSLEVSVSGGTSLRYDTATNQFVYNWKTPLTPGCYTLSVVLGGGVEQAFFNLR
jgi:hypothetical protein